MKNDITKLPKWAQEEIKFLQMKVEALTDKVNELSNVNAGVEETNTFILDGLNAKPLPKNSHIEFRLKDKYGNLENKVSVYIRRDGNIDINAVSKDGSTFVVMPRASNSLYVNFVPEP